MNRRKLLTTIGAGVGGSMLSNNVFGTPMNSHEFDTPFNPLHKRTLERPVSAITIGAGNRGTVYGNFALGFPDEMKIIGVAEPVEFRNNRYAKAHKIAPENCFVTWENVFERPKFADAIIITAPDKLHFAPCMKALELGYDVLLEKPIAPTEKECRQIIDLAKKTGRIVAVCHVLRYAPYFVKMKELLSKGAVGEIIGIHHTEAMHFRHMAHSYVRGNWHNSKEATPIIMSKSCHDLDILRWLIGKPSKQISATGNLKWFRKENAPSGSTMRCTDGCKVERECIYSAIKQYYDARERSFVLDLPDDKSKQGEIIMERLKTTNYGRCVYRMDNDQPDNYLSNIVFTNNVTVSFSIEGITSGGTRYTRVMGSTGEIAGDMRDFILTNYKTGEKTKFSPKAEDVEGYKNDAHGGGDWVLVHDFAQAVAQKNPRLIASGVEDSLESHIMAIRAEESRMKNKVISIKL